MSLCVVAGISHRLGSMAFLRDKTKPFVMSDNKKGEGRGIGYSLVHSLNVHDLQGLSRLKPGTRISIQVKGTQLLELLPAACNDALVGSWSGGGEARTTTCRPA